MIDLVGGVVDELLAGLDALAAEDLTPLFGPALLERLRPLLAAQNRLAAEVARTVREAEVSAAAEVVTVDLDDLADPGTGRGAAHMGFGATISAARARWLACDGQVTRIVMGPDGMPLDHGRTLRLFPPHVRRAAEVRDGGCVFAGCAAPTWWRRAPPAGLDRRRRHRPGRRRAAVRAALAPCVHHGFRVERQADGRWRTWRPDGTEIRTGPQRTGPGRSGPPLATAA